MYVRLSICLQASVCNTVLNGDLTAIDVAENFMKLFSTFIHGG